jgi:Trk K+ transport system NAD-binding subunit
LVPHGNTKLAYGDQVTLVGSEDFSDEVQAVFT